MNKILLLVFAFSSACLARAQVVFCPPGAEWSYNYKNAAAGNPNLQYEKLVKISYLRDSVVDAKTVKVLRTPRFYLGCSYDPGYTLIQQNGDTIFMRNSATNHQWEILYNFNVLAGQSWETQVRADMSASTGSVMYTYTVQVDSVNNVTVNGFSLKRLFTKYYFPETGQSDKLVITERFGSSYYGYMFNYYNNTYGACELYWFSANLCYKDNGFGNIQFTSRPCDFQNLAGISANDKKTIIQLFPNPAENEVSLDFQEMTLEACELTVASATGQKVLHITDAQLDGIYTLNISALPKGFYFLRIVSREGVVGSSKFIKD